MSGDQQDQAQRNMEDAQQDQEDRKPEKGIIARLSTFKGIIVSLTALLVVIPALINSGIDVYKSIANIPAGIQEKTNDELFKRHFKDAPIFSQPIEIKTGNATLEMLLDVYENGDIFVQYGDFSQWFPFKGVSVSRGLPWPGIARAQEIPSSPQTVQQSPMVFDLEKYKNNKANQGDEKPKILEKTYLVSRMQDDFSVFGFSKNYSTTFDAEPGYRIIEHHFREINAKAFELQDIKLINDGKSIVIRFTLKSGSFINQWKGWIKGTLKTVQERVDQP